MTETSTGHAVTVLVGTDHHPFERLVAWADARQRAHQEDRVTIQHGDSRAPQVAAGHSLLPRDEMVRLVADATVVVTHGGPGTIMDVRAAGHRPLVVSRDPRHGEHVDDHQMLFGAWCESKGLVRLVAEVDDLDELIDALGHEGTRDPSAVGGSSTAQAAERVERLLEAGGRGGRPCAPDATRVLHVSGTDPVGVARLAAALEAFPDVVVLHDASGTWRGSTQPHVGPHHRGTAQPGLWSAVGERAFGGWDHAPTEDVRRLHTALQRPTSRLRMARRHPGPAVRRLLVDYAHLHRRLYTAAAEVAGVDLVVDAGGSLATALALSHDAHLDLRAVHVDDAPPRQPVTASARLLERAGVRALRHRRVPVLRLGPGDLDPDDGHLVRTVRARLGLAEAPPVGTPSELSERQVVGGRTSAGRADR